MPLARNLRRRETRARAVLRLRRVERPSRHDDGDDTLPPLPIGTPTTATSRTVQFLGEHALDLCGIHVDASALHHVAGATREIQVALVVDSPEVFDGPIPVAVRFARRFRVARVAEHRLRVTNTDMPVSSPDGKGAPVGVEDANLLPRERSADAFAVGQHLVAADQRDPPDSVAP